MRKTKLFILLTFLLSIGLNSWAADAISCSAYLSGTAGTATTTDCSLAYYSDEGSAGTIPAGSLITVSEVNYHYAKMNDDKNYYVVTLNKTVGGNTYSTFKAGDVITVYLYSNSSTVAYKVGKTSKTSVSLTEQTKSTIITAPHTLTAAEIESNGTIRIYRNSSNTHFAGISVSGSRATEKFTVTFNAGSNGTCGTASLTEASPGAGVTLPAVTPNSGYAFTGWYTATSEGTKVGDAGDTYNPTANITIHAQYIEQSAPGISIDSYSPSTPRGKAVTFTATATGAPTPTVTWYQSATATTSGGTEKGTGTTYNPNVATVGTYYYYAVASNGVSPDATSELITLTVSNPDIDREGYNTYYVTNGETAVGGKQVLCDDITMVYDNVTYNTASTDNMINALNTNYVASINSSTNDWGVTFTPTVDAVLSVGLIANKDKYIEVTNVTSFAYVDKDGNYGTYTGTKSTKLGAKFYGIVTFNVVSGETYKVSVTGGSKMVLYGFELSPTVSATITDAGWSTFASTYALNLSSMTASTGTVKAYYASAASGSTVTLTQTTAIVPAGEGIMLKGTDGATITIPVAASGTAIDGNLLKGQTATGTVDASNKDDNGKYHYVFGYSNTNASVYGFYNLASDTEVPAGKAYLETTTALTAGAPAIIRIADEENGATNINTVDAVEEGVKFFQNGKLYIKKNGVVYDMMGTVVR